LKGVTSTLVGCNFCSSTSFYHGVLINCNLCSSTCFYHEVFVVLALGSRKEKGPGRVLGIASVVV
jgi:hypothetical protein